MHPLGYFAEEHILTLKHFCKEQIAIGAESCMLLEKSSSLSELSLRWPAKLPHGLGAASTRPAAAAEAAKLGWKKMNGEPSNPLLGEALVLGGERSKGKPASLCFAPQAEGAGRGAGRSCLLTRAKVSQRRGCSFPL